MFCKNLTRKVNGGLKCTLTKKAITLDKCKECSHYQVKKQKAIIKKTQKQRNLEKSRFSILTDNLEYCYWCYKTNFSKVKRDDLHEIYGGRNRKRSILHGFVVPLCRKHHEDEAVKHTLKRLCQTVFEKNHTREEFIKIIGKSSL